MMNRKIFADLGFSQRTKHGQKICGDVFKYSKIAEEQRITAVLSDGLGSGVKANIQASITATMALRFAIENMDMPHSAEIMMRALPVCQVRNISYATFTIVDTTINGQTRIIEMGNPPFILVRGRIPVKTAFTELKFENWENRDLRLYNVETMLNDRMIFFSDGITQAGTGSEKYPLGWQLEACEKFITTTVAAQPEISAHELANCIIREAARKENSGLPADDMTCSVLYFRKPRAMLLFSGPPFDRTRDAQCARRFASFKGEKVIAGGTSSEIISRELDKQITLDSESISHSMPPSSRMDGVELVCEGLVTLTHAAEMLENNSFNQRFSPAGKMIDIFMRNDVITFLVGTRINDAYQDPKMSTELEFRRNIIQRIAKSLKDDFLKEINIEYI